MQATTTASTLTTVRSIRDNLQARFSEREAEIQGLLIAALAGEHSLMIGPPGTGKSALARAFADAFAGANYFETLLTRYSTPEEVFGPVSLSGLKQDRFTRVTAGKLPTAHVAFLDEIFKANSAILNSCLTALNERIFHDDGKPVSMPLLTCVGASNEMPEGQELAALWDRFVVRYFVAYTRREDSFASMIRGAVPPVTGALTLEAWGSIRAEVDAVDLPDSAVAELFRLRTNLLSDGIEVSDRRWVKATKLLRASAWLSGASAVGPSHFGILTACLWNTPDQAEKVRERVQTIAGADILKAERIYDAVIRLVKDLQATNGGSGWVERAGVARKEITKAITKIVELRDANEDASIKARLTEISDALESNRTELTASIKTTIGLDF